MHSIDAGSNPDILPKTIRNEYEYVQPLNSKTVNGITCNPILNRMELGGNKSTDYLALLFYSIQFNSKKLYL